MSTIRPERLATELVLTPGLSDRYNALDTLDAARVLTELVHNPAHLCEESVRHLVWDAGSLYDALSGDDYGDYGSAATNDSVQPTPSQLVQPWQRVAGDRRMVRRYGPFATSADNIADSAPIISQNGSARRVRVVIEIGIDPTALVFASVFAVLTKTGDAADVRANRILAGTSITGSPALSAGVNTVRFDLEPSSAIDATRFPDRTFPSAPTSGARRVVSPLHTFFLHVGAAAWAVSATDYEILSVSAFEIRE